MNQHPLSDPDLEITPAEAARRLREDDVQLIDVRETYEWEAGRIDGARHVEIERLSGQAATIDKDRPVIFQCRLGNRSLMAAQAFSRAGYDAYSMAGGLEAWHEQGLPLEPADGHVAPH